jgi:hypothetical protein
MTPEERAALIAEAAVLRTYPAAPGSIVGMLIRAADQLEADGARLALADGAPHEHDCNFYWSGQGVCTCWKADYTAQEGALDE